MKNRMFKRPFASHNDTPALIVQQWYKPTKGNIAHSCQHCSKHVAHHEISFYDDLRASMKYALLGTPESEITEIIWQKAIREQAQGRYQIHGIIHACDACIAQTILEATGEAEIPASYLEAVNANKDASLLIGRMKHDPSRTVMIFTVARTISEFMDEFREQSSKNSGPKQITFKIPFLKYGDFSL